MKNVSDAAIRFGNSLAKIGRAAKKGFQKNFSLKAVKSAKAEPIYGDDGVELKYIRRTIESKASKRIGKGVGQNGGKEGVAAKREKVEGLLQNLPKRKTGICSRNAVGGSLGPPQTNRRSGSAAGVNMGKSSLSPGLWGLSSDGMEIRGSRMEKVDKESARSHSIALLRTVPQFCKELCNPEVNFRKIVDGSGYRHANRHAQVLQNDVVRRALFSLGESLVIPELIRQIYAVISYRSVRSELVDLSDIDSDEWSRLSDALDELKSAYRENVNLPATVWAKVISKDGLTEGNRRARFDDFIDGIKGKAGKDIEGDLKSLDAFLNAQGEIVGQMTIGLQLEFGKILDEARMSA